MLFKELSLIEPLLRALETEGYEQPTPIQEQAIPVVLSKRDLLGCAQTGTGKTAAFALPMLQLLAANNPTSKGSARPIRALILTPTRELAIQIGESFTAYGRNLPIRNFVVFGGVGQTPQTDALKRGTDVLIATPGRLLDLMNQGYVNLREISIFVLDEADRMLDMGFIHDVKKVIAKLPSKRQTLFFSATMPDEIANLANSILTDPLRVEVTPASTTAENVEQAVYFVDKQNKKHLLAHLLKDKSIRSALVFTRTKHGANKVAADVTKAGVFAEAIHGNKSQNARQAALQNFKTGRTRVLVATDIAARGIDIDELSHVVNYELPNIPETYVHRIGRTGRAGASGIAVSFCEAEEIPYLKDIQKLTGQLVPVIEEHPYAADITAPGLPQPAAQRGKGSNRNNSGGGNKQDQKVPAPQRPDMIPLPDRRPDTQRPPFNRPTAATDGDETNGNNRNNQPRPQRDPQQQRPERPAQQNNGSRDANRNGRDDRRSVNSGQRRDDNRPGDRRDDNRPGDRRDDNRPGDRRDDNRPGDRRDNNNREDRRDDGNRRDDRRDDGNRREPSRPQQQRPPQQQKPEAKPSREEVASAMRNRFASILEVSSIEKQNRPPKPKPDYRDRDDRNSTPKDKPFGGGGGPKRRR